MEAMVEAQAELLGAKGADARPAAQPALDGHWLAVSIARAATEALLWRWQLDEAAAAARCWRQFAKTVLDGALAYDAAVALEAEAAAAVARGAQSDAVELYSAALLEASALQNELDSEDPLVYHLFRQLQCLE